MAITTASATDKGRESVRFKGMASVRASYIYPGFIRFFWLVIGRAYEIDGFISVGVISIIFACKNLHCSIQYLRGEGLRGILCIKTHHAAVAVTITWSIDG